MPRITLNRNINSDDSPKTPVRHSISPNVFDTSSPLQAHNDSCSTPISSKRSHFLEESPSQDNDSFNLYLPQLSQDDQTNILDVGWKWEESPKGSKNSLGKKNQEKLTKLNKITKKSVPKKNKIINKVENNSETEGHGFYKFRDELLKIKSLENWNSTLDNFNDNGPDLSLSLKENENNSNREINIKNKLETKNDSKSKEKIKAKEENADIFFNDSFDDSDNLLIELSQKIENEICKNKNVDKKINNNTNKVMQSIIKEDIVGNDSFDNVLLSIPLDDKEIKKTFPTSTKTVMNTNKQHTSTLMSSPKNTSLSRYNSMPSESTAIISVNNKKNNSPRNLIRHNSMPTNNAPTRVGNQNPSITSTNENPKISKTLSEEIERRRLEAKQRLALTMQRKMLKKMK